MKHRRIRRPVTIFMVPALAGPASTLTASRPGLKGERASILHFQDGSSETNTVTNDERRRTFTFNVAETVTRVTFDGAEPPDRSVEWKR